MRSKIVSLQLKRTTLLLSQCFYLISKRLAVYLKQHQHLRVPSFRKYIKCNQTPPLLTFTKFEGDQLEWETFRDVFQAIINDTKLSDVHKLYYLSNSLSSKAADRIRNISISDSNYTKGNMLNRRYGNERVLFSAHMLRTLSCHPATKNQYIKFYVYLMHRMNQFVYLEIWVNPSIDGTIELFTYWFISWILSAEKMGQLP